ncbi:MAG: hypothetical protein ACE5KD_00705 [Candidatus Bathyarchaeia archaeon]
MVKTTVHVRGKKIKVDIILADREGKFTLDPDDAMELGIKLLKAAYTAKIS